MLRKLVLGAGATVLFGGGVGLGVLVAQTDSTRQVTDEERAVFWRSSGREYDAKVGAAEDGNGITAQRKALMAHARGRTLEVAAGTGRNLQFLLDNSNVREIVLTDAHEGMLQVMANETTPPASQVALDQPPTSPVCNDRPLRVRPCPFLLPRSIR
ncbi:uncharacterized protein MONBRDRAFT_24784 [Monosiga brevicollis MX1]|uniref:Methyltransferase domain-containing protein n=1 Tax=Monosiga brevicollis TaxID=81824 RepID=A9UXQ4_MONBE|nr:uncharacterized protein MONBRDRAFT_24784 [Monosiga brevicollis MX1]EDQ89883.1 predicted protein [Monosiga brevicollis MX1]|eukprot:XP_001745305.1 hypothetical protein [Monosiga brevicollis MX1]